MNSKQNIETALIDLPISAAVRLLYFVCRLLAFPLLVLYFLYRGARDPRYLSNFAERFGGQPARFQPTAPGAIWLHAVSVGEALSSVRLIEELRAANPAVPVYVSIATVAGRDAAEAKLSMLVSGIFWAPIDYPFAIRPVLRRIRPSVIVIVETELWPALYREAKRAACALAIVNGRISERSFPRYRRFRFFFRSTMRLPDTILAQSEADRARYIALGAPAEIVTAAGNLKYDAPRSETAPPRMVRDLIARLQPDAIWIAASTMPPADAEDVDEDDAVLDAFGELAGRHPRLLLILAPRKPERFDAAAERLRRRGLAFVRRSSGAVGDGAALPCALLLDSIGELASAYPAADVVFMGGTLARRGGHNILEPATCGKPVIMGPHMENFAAIAAAFRAHGGAVEIRGPQELAGAVERLLADGALRERIGRQAEELARKGRGAAAMAAREILKLQDLALPAWDRPGPSYPLLWTLARAWSAVSGWKRKRGMARAHSLPAPVISIGGLAMGGVGKTPFVELIANRLRQRGHNPAILTRGYGRDSIERTLVVPAGRAAPVRATGDEPQIFVRAAHAHVGIGSDRWSAGTLMQQTLRPGVFLLDDGFQHWPLRRDLDIVLIDSLNPFAGGAVFPLGHLREPPAALRRAGAVVITRTQPGRAYEGIRRRVRDAAPHAPVFAASVRASYWVHEKTHGRVQTPPGPAAAFCGLANPAAFWQTLAALGIQPVSRWAFGDHHRYKSLELRRLAFQARSRGAQAFLTTEKDAMNLAPNALEVLAPVELYWLKIETVVEREEELIELIEACMRAPSGG